MVQRIMVEGEKKQHSGRRGQGMGSPLPPPLAPPSPVQGPARQQMQQRWQEAPRLGAPWIVPVQFQP